VEFPFTEEHIQKRLAFANKYKDWTTEDWAKVIFSDETTFQLYPDHPYMRVIRPLKEALNPEYLAHRMAHSPTVNLWGCFSAQGIGQAWLFNGTVDGPRYVQILKEQLKPTWQSLFPDGVWYFLQDNASPHTSIVAKTWLHNNGVNCIDFPPHSPDLNPIENLWADLKRRVESRHPTDQAEMEAAVGEEYEATEQKYLLELVESMPKRLKACIANNGHRTAY
jgi:hypothetical protein